MEDTIEKKILSWLEEQGYPLEMEVASIAKEMDFDVSQSDYYIDPESDEGREIDLVVSKDNFAGKFNRSYNLLIECKSSKKQKPWLVFSEDNELVGDADSIEEHLAKFHRFSSLLATPIAESYLMKLGTQNELDNIYPRLGIEPHLGYGVAQAFNTNSDVAFKAMMSATKASISSIKRFCIPGLSEPCAIAIPVIVIDSPLFSVSRNSCSNDLKIKRVHCAEILWKHLVASKSRIGVFVVERSHLSGFLSKCKISSDWWLNLDESELDKIRNEIKDRNAK